MRNVLAGGLSALLLFGLAGCGGNTSGAYSRQMKQVIKDFTDLTEACKAIKQDGQLEGGAPRLMELRRRLDSDCNQLKALEPPSDREKLRLQRKYTYIVLSARVGLYRQETRILGWEKGKQYATDVFANTPLPLPLVNGLPFQESPFDPNVQ